MLLKILAAQAITVGGLLSDHGLRLVITNIFFNTPISTFIKVRSVR